MYLNFQTFDYGNLSVFYVIPVMGTMYSNVQHYFKILQFRYGGEE